MKLGEKVLGLHEANPTLSMDALAAHFDVSYPFVNKVLSHSDRYKPALNAGGWRDCDMTNALARLEAIVGLVKRYCEKEIEWCNNVGCYASGENPTMSQPPFDLKTLDSKKQALKDVLAITQAGGA